MEQRIRAVFQSVFHLDGEALQDDWGPGDIDGWDSLGHLNLLAGLEKEFNVKFQTDEVVAMENVKAVKDILAKKGC